MDVSIDLGPELEPLWEELRRLRAEVEALSWPRWMSVEVCAGYTSCSPERIRKLVGRRGIPYRQEGPGCRLFFDRLEVDAWMEARRP